jgi:polyisoprenyl-teichoic acid--peptidoglycan teichoic acid transferase
MRRWRRLIAIPIVFGTAAAVWSSLGSFTTASGQEKPIAIMRAHAGSYRPDPTKPVFVLVLGTDARAHQSVEGARSDSIHILAIDPTSRSATMIGIPRDSWVRLASGGSNKINAAIGRPNMTRTVEILSGCSFHYTMMTGFKGFIQLVNDFGGLPVNVRKPVNDRFADLTLSPGFQKLSGAKALGYARVRHDGRFSPRGDFDRGIHQGELMIAALQKARKEIGGNPGRVLHYLAAMLRNVRTNIPAGEALRLGMLVLQIKPANVANLEADGYTQTINGASAVRLTGKATSLMRDVCADGVIGRSS